MARFYKTKPTYYHMRLHQMDVKCAFLNGIINEEVYVKQPPYFESDAFPKHKDFEMSMMGELMFFIRLQIKQAEDEIYIHKTKYVKELLKKFNLKDCKMFACVHDVKIILKNHTSLQSNVDSYILKNMQNMVTPTNNKDAKYDHSYEQQGLGRSIIAPMKLNTLMLVEPADVKPSKVELFVVSKKR
ncbi:hypothetical protein CR513_47093, partial [Mucuna pruriens]